MRMCINLPVLSLIVVGTYSEAISVCVEGNYGELVSSSLLCWLVYRRR